MVNRVRKFFTSATKRFGSFASPDRKKRRRLLTAAENKGGQKITSEEQPDPSSPPESAKPVPQQIGLPSEKMHPPSATYRHTAKSAWSLDDFCVTPLPGKSRFHDFAIDLRIMRGIAEERFNYCTPIQDKALPPTLNGCDVICRAQTGTGKSAVFLIALFCRLLQEQQEKHPYGHPRALIIAPTRELVIQITKDGRKLCGFSPLHIGAVYGGAGYKKQEEMLSTRYYDVIVATPGRLLDFIRRHVIDLSRCSRLVIDEADRMLDMGFIPDVRRIVSSMPDRKNRQTMLFSATISDDVRRMAQQWCNNPVSVEAGEETIDVDRIEQRVYLTTQEEKYAILYNLIASASDERILIFTNMKSEAANLSKQLKDNGLNCQLLTGDVPQHKRLVRLEAFRAGKSRVLVATDVAGRGIHISEITYVINYSLPYEPEDYVHRIGRTGRAGADGVAISFACEKGSFYLPAIETYIGRTLPCLVPEEHLVKPPPEPIFCRQTEKPRRRKGRRRPPKPHKKTRNTGTY
jgi:ATP-dependent RNA helicase RhlB